VELRPLSPSDDDLLSSLEQQEDVWEFVGTLPLPDEEHPHHLFAIIEGQASVGVAGLVRSQALDGTDFELLCALRSEAQGRGFAKQACTLVMAWAFDTLKLERVIASIGDGNDGARSIATKLGMTAVRSGPHGRTVYVKDRETRQREPQQRRSP
jgi:RimJ/RimL family protein N-acetyltransferase